MPRTHTKIRHRQLTPKMRKAKRAAHAARNPQPSPEEIEAMREQIRARLDRVAAVIEAKRAREREGLPVDAGWEPPSFPC